jgi:hypothetical protein
LKLLFLLEFKGGPGLYIAKTKTVKLLTTIHKVQNLPNRSLTNAGKWNFGSVSYAAGKW